MKNKKVDADNQGQYSDGPEFILNESIVSQKLLMMTAHKL